MVQESPLARAQFSRFTNWEGTEGGAEISPDGKFVAFKANRDGEVDLWVKQVGAGTFLNLTKDVPPLSLPGIVRTFGFNDNSSEIWFAEGGDSSNPKLLVPVTGGAARPFMGKGAAAPSWSPDICPVREQATASGDSRTEVRSKCGKLLLPTTRCRNLPRRRPTELAWPSSCVNRIHSAY